jgi:hypothetical protein
MDHAAAGVVVNGNFTRPGETLEDDEAPQGVFLARLSEGEADKVKKKTYAVHGSVFGPCASDASFVSSPFS